MAAVEAAGSHSVRSYPRSTGRPSSTTAFMGFEGGSDAGVVAAPDQRQSRPRHEGDEEDTTHSKPFGRRSGGHGSDGASRAIVALRPAGPPSGARSGMHNGPPLRAGRCGTAGIASGVPYAGRPGATIPRLLSSTPPSRPVPSVPKNMVPIVGGPEPRRLASPMACEPAPGNDDAVGVDERLVRTNRWRLWPGWCRSRPSSSVDTGRR